LSQDGAELGSKLHVPKRVRAELGSEVVDKVDEAMESSDERFGIDRSGLELELCETVNGKRHVGVQVGCQHFC